MQVPEIPCSIDTSDDISTYIECVDSALDAMDYLDDDFRDRLRDCAIQGYHDEHGSS